MADPLFPDSFRTDLGGVSDELKRIGDLADGVSRTISTAFRGAILDGWEASGAGAIEDGGVYWQATGPRFETPAEIRLMAAHAHLVGMTIASECVIAAELGLEYAALCMVDNLANGLADGELSVDEMEADRLINSTKLREGLAAVLPRLGVVGR